MQDHRDTTHLKQINNCSPTRLTAVKRLHPAGCAVRTLQLRAPDQRRLLEAVATGQAHKDGKLQEKK